VPRDSRCTENLREPVGFVVDQSKGQSSVVRLGSFIHDDLEVAAPPDDDPNPDPVPNVEFEAQADAGQ
jgi:hypothetical protein